MYTKTDKQICMKYLYILPVILALSGCAGKTEQSMNEGKYTLMVLDPGHFHASLVQKTMYPGIDSTVYVYAPEGMELEDYLARVRSYNERQDQPTNWNLKVYRGDDYLEKMIEERPGDLVVLAGNNQLKTENIAACTEAGIHVYADKPMAIVPEDYRLLKETFDKAEEKELLIYDIMTERFEITTILQKKLSEQEEIFGGLINGSQDTPAITKESVHHFFKYVSGSPLQRPAWFFDIRQEGEAIADVGTHLVDLVLWEAFPGGIQDYKEELEIVRSERWATPLSPDQFNSVTGEESFPAYLGPYVENDTLYALSNSSVDFRIRGTYARVSVEWAFMAPEGAGDTHYSIMRGEKCDLVIRQGAEEKYRPELYIIANENTNREALLTALEVFLEEELNDMFPGVGLEDTGKGSWRLVIPQVYREGHEAHFARVTEQFLEYLENGAIPQREIEQMLTKYYITTRAVDLARDR